MTDQIDFLDDDHQFVVAICYGVNFALNRLKEESPECTGYQLAVSRLETYCAELSTRIAEASLRAAVRGGVDIEAHDIVTKLGSIKAVKKTA